MILPQYYLFGGFLVSLLGFSFVLSLLHENKRSKKKKENAAAAIELESSGEKISGGGECRSEGGGADVIIVGAGVAGSALAYTLGKVSFLSFLFFPLIPFICLDFNQKSGLDWKILGLSVILIVVFRMVRFLDEHVFFFFRV